MRIAWTGPVGTGGGVPGMGRLLLRELVRQGVEVDVYLVSYDFEALPIDPIPGLRIVEHRSRWRWGRWYSSTKAGALFSGLAVRTLGNVALTLRLLARHRRAPYDAVYQLSQIELFLLGRLRRFAPPIVVHPCVHAAGELRWHRRESAYALRSERRVVHLLMRALLLLRSRLQPGELARADLVLGLSERFNELLREDCKVAPEKQRVVRTPVDLERFHPGGADERATPRKLLFISRISVRKGVAEIVELSHRLADLAGSVRLVVIGGPTLWSDYRAHLDDLDPAVAEYVGGVRTEELPCLMRSAAVLIVPSRYEPGSIATAEALACGLPVVLSDEVGAGEVVAGPHVRFFEAGDVDGLEVGVRGLLRADDPVVGVSARANAEAFFSVSLAASQLIDCFASLAPGDNRPLRAVPSDNPVRPRAPEGVIAVRADGDWWPTQ